MVKSLILRFTLRRLCKLENFCKAVLNIPSISTKVKHAFFGVGLFTTAIRLQLSYESILALSFLAVTIVKVFKSSFSAFLPC